MDQRHARGRGQLFEDMPTIAVRRDQGPFHRRKEEDTKNNLFVPVKDSGRAERSCFRGCPKTTEPLER
jgi:hypothetical protein